MTPRSLLALIVIPASALASPLAHESFDYAQSSALANQNGGAGWAGPWQAPASAKLAENQSLVSGVPYFGRCAALDGNTRVRRPLDVSPGGVFDRAGLVADGLIGRDGTTLYIGFMQRVTVEPTVKGGQAAYLRYYSFELNRSDSDTKRVLEIGHDDRSNPPNGPYYGAASVLNNGLDSHEPGQYQSLGEPDTKWNTIVVKLTFGAADYDTVEVFRNPESRTDESAITVDATLKGQFQFNRIALARFVGNAPVHLVDEIRLGTEYADAFAPIDEAKIKSVVAKAEAQVRERATACRTRIEAISRKGIPTAHWAKRLASIVRPGRDASPWRCMAALDELDQSMALADVDLGVDRLLFVKRHMFKPTHIYTEYSDGPYRPGGGIFALSPVHPDGDVTRLFDAKGGIVRDPDVSFDGRRVLFSYRPSVDGHYHIHEMNVGGTGLRQITDGPFHDLDPFYLPDGRIGFTSTRCKSRALCFWVRAATLFVMNADGSNIHPITSNNVNEFTPQLLPDGRILYTRWEYMDKSAIFVQSLWSINPDGTRAQQIHGNNLIHPVSQLQARLIPGTDRIACILGAHNGDSVGPLATVDPIMGVANIAAIVDFAPECDYHSGCFAPFPLSNRWCLVSYGPHEPFGIYAFDIDPPADSVSARKADVPRQSSQHPRNLSQYFRTAVTDRHLVYREETYSCVEAMPIRPRPRPSVVAASGTSDTREGELVLVDVYQGLGGAVPRGAVKYLRVVEEMGHRDDGGRRDYEGAFDRTQFRSKYQRGFMSLYASPWESRKPAPSLQAKWVHGTVPVEPDGSAYFTVPADRPVYFQALDKDYNELQRMRSYIHLRPGENQSCIGCHEPRTTTPRTVRNGPPMALRREPSQIEPPPFGAGPFSYQELVQPILDKHCAACHSAEKPAGGVDLSCRPDGRRVPASYATLVRPRTNPDRPPLVNFFDNWWGVSTTVPVAKLGTFGARVSRLMEMIDTRHKGVQMSEACRAQIGLSSAKRRIITTWIDLNCPLWGNYSPETRRP